MAEVSHKSGTHGKNGVPDFIEHGFNSRGFIIFSIFLI